MNSGVTTVMATIEPRISHHPIDRIMARIKGSETYSKHLAVSYFLPSDSPKLRKSETLLAAVGRRAAVDTAATEACYNGATLALREQDLLSVQMILTCPYLYRMDGETDNSPHRETYLVVTGDKPKHHTYLTQPITENEAQILQYSAPLTILYVKGFTSDINVVTTQVRAVRQTIEGILQSQENPPKLMYFVSRRPYSINGTFIADHTLRVLSQYAIQPAILNKLLDGLGIRAGETCGYMEFAGYRLWTTTVFVPINAPVPAFVLEAVYHVTQLPLSSMHNAETVLELIRQEPRSISDKILDVFTYRFMNQRLIMIKWTHPGIFLSNDVTRAITGLESSIQKKVGLHAFTQLKERNAKLNEATEYERKRKLQHTPISTPARGEDYTTVMNATEAKQVKAEPTENIHYQELLKTQTAMISRMDELTEVSNQMAEAQPVRDLATRMDKQDETLKQMQGEQAKTNLLLESMLAQLKPAQSGATGTTPGFRTQVVKPGQTTPAAVGGPQTGSSGRP